MHSEEMWLLNEKYQGEKSIAFSADLKRLKAGEPLAYVIGFVPFLNTKIYLDSKPLIPRPETEYWVEKAIEEITLSGIQAPRVLDLCAGSGAIGVAVLKAIHKARVDFAEIDEAHHDTITTNIGVNGIDPTRMRIFGGDLFKEITSRYNYILSNPPYIDPKLDKTEASVKDFEPHQALYGGNAGMEIIERIIASASAHLTQNGTLYLEHEPEQESAIREYGARYGLPTDSKADQYGTIRYTRLFKKESGAMAQ